MPIFIIALFTLNINDLRWIYINKFYHCAYLEEITCFLGSSLFKLKDNKSAKSVPQKSDDYYDDSLYT